MKKTFSLFVFCCATLFSYAQIEKPKASSSSNTNSKPSSTTSSTISYPTEAVAVKSLLKIKGKDVEPFNKNGGWGYLDNSTGEVIVNPVFDLINPFFDSVAIIKFRGKYGLVNTKGVLVIPFKYEEARRSNSKGFFVKINGKCGLVDKSSITIIPFKYDSLGEVIEQSNYFIYKKGFEKGFLVNGIEIPIHSDFSSASKFDDDTTLIELKNSRGSSALFSKRNQKLIIDFSNYQEYLKRVGSFYVFESNDFGVGTKYFRNTWNKTRVYSLEGKFVANCSSFTLLDSKVNSSKKLCNCEWITPDLVHYNDVYDENGKVNR